MNRSEENQFGAGGRLPTVVLTGIRAASRLKSGAEMQSRWTTRVQYGVLVGVFLSGDL
jgi:hypothetical protein